MTDDRYDKVTFHGKTVDKWTRAALLEAERRLGYELTIVQGSYHAGVGASAGTHDGGGVVDLLPWDWENKVRVLRTIGFAAWHRPAISGLWGEHIHAVLLGNEKASAAAKDQMSDYRLGRDGLAGNHSDPDPWRPSPIPTFKYPPAPIFGPVTKAVRVAVATANAGNARDAKVQADALNLGKVARVILWQEFGDRQHVHPAPGMVRHKGNGQPGQSSTPIDYDPRLFVPGTITTGSVFVTGRVKVPKKVPGPSPTKPKHANWVRGQLADNGRWLRLVSFHGAVQPHSNPISERLGDRQVDSLVQLVEETWKGDGLVVMGGDWNRDVDTDPDIDRLEAAGMVWAKTGPTHGKREYDAVFYLDRGEKDERVKVATARTIDTSSDHRAVLAVLEVAGMVTA